MLNAVGLENPGVEDVIKNYIPHLASRFHKPLVANISGFSLEEYIDCAVAMNREEHVGIIEVNISCPNVHGGGLAFGADPKAATMVTRAVKESVSKPVYIKLSPSGIKSPIYCDNRLTLSYPKTREKIEKAFAQTIAEKFPQVDRLMGTKDRRAHV